MKINSNNLIIVISSPSGAGKTTVCKKILERDNKIGISISDTTRLARNNEVNGLDYNFISEKEFMKRVQENAYIEYANVFGNYYGSLRSNIADHFEKNRDILFDIDWQGAEQLNNSNFSNIVSIFIVPPSKDVVYERLKQRAETSGDDLKAINSRMNKYETELSHRTNYDYNVINEELSVCTDEIEKIINKHRTN